MDSQQIFISLDNQTFISIFKPLSKADSLPFPLNAEFPTTVLMTLYLSLNLIFGCMLRAKILLYAKSLNIKDNPINVFIWYDQLSGIFMAMNIAYTLTLLHLPFPLVSITGESICNWTDLMGNLYLMSQAVWSCFIALYRMLYIKFQRLFQNGIKESRFAIVLSIIGYCFVTSSAGFLAHVDKGILYNLCSHHSVKEVDSLNVSGFSFNYILFIS